MPSVAEAKTFDVISDAVDEGTPSASLPVVFLTHTSSVVSRAVNVLKAKFNNGAAHTKATTSWDDESVFDKGKEKRVFRQYDDACDRVKEFYREQHGTRLHQLLSHPR